MEKGREKNSVHALTHGGNICHGDGANKSKAFIKRTLLKYLAARSSRRTSSYPVATSTRQKSLIISARLTRIQYHGAPECSFDRASAGILHA